MINVSGLKKGIVIDHISRGGGFSMFAQLGLDRLDDVTLLMRNVPSRKMGLKDLIKIETDLTLDLDVLGLIDPGVTVNYISDGQIIRKMRLRPPETVEGILECRNPRCITASENVPRRRFTLCDAQKLLYVCEHCGAVTGMRA